MGSVRKNYPAALKVKVALAALKEDKTLAQLSSEFGIHPHQIQEWKKRLLAEAPAIFSSRRSRVEQDAAALQAELYRQIGQLKVEVDWLKKRVETGH